MEISIIVALSTSSKPTSMQHTRLDHDSLSPPQGIQQPSTSRPPPLPLAPQRQQNRPQPHGQPGAPPRNTLSSLLTGKAGNAPIPPSLQAKMMAVRPSVPLPLPAVFILYTLRWSTAAHLPRALLPFPWTPLHKFCSARIWMTYSILSSANPTRSPLPLEFVAEPLPQNATSPASSCPI